MLNCIYDCKYCFLEGMFNSANYLLFINSEDYFKEIEKNNRRYSDNRVCFFSGYDCDSLALEHVTGFASSFINFFKNIKVHF